MNYLNSQIEAAISETIHSERDRRIMMRIMVDGIKLEPLAEAEDLSVRHVKTLSATYKKIIRAYLASTAQL